jgi:hypothetical protein
MLAPGKAAAAQRAQILHPFCAKASCADGSSPQYGLIADDNGVLYGTAPSGGSGNSGVVYALTPNGTGYTYGVLYRFCSAGAVPCVARPETDPAFCQTRALRSRA